MKRREWSRSLYFLTGALLLGVVPLVLFAPLALDSVEPFADWRPGAQYGIAALLSLCALSLALLAMYSFYRGLWDALPRSPSADEVLAEVLHAQKVCLESLALRFEGHPEVYDSDADAAYAARDRVRLIDQTLDRLGYRVSERGCVGRA